MKLVVSGGRIIGAEDSRVASIRACRAARIRCAASDPSAGPRIVGPPLWQERWLPFRPELPANRQTERPAEAGRSRGYYREERYVMCVLWEADGQAPSGRLNLVEVVSARCTEPKPTMKIDAVGSLVAAPTTMPATIRTPASR